MSRNRNVTVACATNNRDVALKSRNSFEARIMQVLPIGNDFLKHGYLTVVEVSCFDEVSR